MYSVVSNLYVIASLRSSDLTRGREVAETQGCGRYAAFFHIREGATVSDHRKQQNQE